MSARSRPGRLLRPFLGSVLLGSLFAGLLAREMVFVARARRAPAVVVESWIYGRQARTIAEVDYRADGRPVRATLRAWSVHLTPGERVGVLYRPEDPGEVKLDRFWQLHFGSVIALVMFASVGLSEALRYRGRSHAARREESFQDAGTAAAAHSAWRHV